MSTDTEKEVILDMHKMYFGSSLLNIREKHVSWDEQTISEHDKERGTRRIINEPKTPYNRLGIPEKSDEELVDEREELLRRLQELDKSLKKNTKARVGFAESSSSQNQNEKEERHKEFLMRRKLHYNEYQEVLKMRKLEKEENDD